MPRRPRAHVSTSMGVGGLLIWLKEAFPEAFTQPETRRSHLLIDANSQVHDAIRNSRGARETEVIRRFVSSVDQLVQQYQPSRGLSVALDGPAPLAKLETQRQRRSTVKVPGSQRLTRPPTTPEAQPLAQGCPLALKREPLPLGCRREPALALWCRLAKVTDSTAFDHPGVDLLAASLPEAAHGFMQRALRSAPKREADLIAEIMGSLCVTLNQLRRHALWKATTQRLGQCALQL